MAKKNVKQKTKTFTKRAIQNLAGNKQSHALQYHRQTIVKLGLQDFFQKFINYFSRCFHKKEQHIIALDSINNTKDSFFNDDILHYVLHIHSTHKMQSLIQALDSEIAKSIKFPKVHILDKELIVLAKNGILRLYDIFAFMQMVKFFYDFCNQDNVIDEYLNQYLSKFTFPQEILDLVQTFDFNIKIHSTEINSYSLESNIKNYIKKDADKELYSYCMALESKHKERQELLYKTLQLSNIQDYLVDKQIHFFEGNQTLLVRPGYSNVIHARVSGRSANGFFYIIPFSLDSLDRQINVIEDKIEERLFILAKQYSKILNKHIHFLRFINTEYEFMDKALARVRFAKDLNLNFIFTSDCNNILLRDYSHPSIKKPIPFSINFSKNLLMITGVNAGGKTMLLKSILSALLCARLLIPMKINANSKLPFIKNIHIIAQDPQDSHNDISTFSGRIKEISCFLNEKELMLGIDEIEIGTDASEAASLYKVILNQLLKNGAKIIVTTHHKHLASLMADNPHTQLVAAIYDYVLAKPTFEFIDGVGKSYAMECASHYGIPQDLITEAKKVHGDEANKLERLIEESSYQITKNKQDSLKLNKLIQEQESKNKELDEMKKHLKQEFEKQSLDLKRHYNEAIKEIKMLAKQSQKNLQALEGDKISQDIQTTTKNIHKLLNKTQKNQSETPQIKIESNVSFKVGDYVKHRNKFAQVIEANKNEYTIEFNNGVKIKAIKAIDLVKVNKPRYESKAYTLQADIKANTTLDLHGYTKEEAIEAVELFLNQAIMAGFKEVLIIHGMGSGALRRTIDNFLNECDYISGYTQASIKRGGMSAKTVYLK